MTYIPAGSLLFAPYNPDDYPTFVSNTGAYLGLPANDPLFDTDGFGTVTQGVIQLDNGRLCVTNLGNFQNGVFNADMTLRAVDPTDNPSSIAGGYDNGFFYGIRKDYPFGGNKLITKISSDTAFTVATYNTAETVQDVFALAVARDESFAYYAMTAGVRPGDVIRLNLSTLAKTTFVTAAGRLSDYNGMFCLRDGSLMVAWDDGTIIHYSTAGAVLHTYTRADVMAITPGLTDASFWVSYFPPFPGVASAQEIDVATGALLQDFALPTGDPPAAHAGNASSTNWGQTFCVINTAIGSPPIVDPPTPDDDPCRITTPLYWAAIEPSEELGDVLQGAQTPLRDPAEYYGGYKPALIQSIGNITRLASDYLTASLPAQSASVVWADTRRFVRDVFDSFRADFTSSPLWIYLIDNVTRLALGVPRLLFYGFIFEDPTSQNLTYTTNANDLVGKDYSLLGDEVLIPKRTIRADEFPGCPRETVGGGVPIIGGTVSNADLALLDAQIAGAIKLIDVGDYVCQDGITRRALLVCGHAVSSLTLFQAGAEIPSGDYGLNAWAPGETGWTDIVPSDAPYVEINDRWFTLVFVSGKRARALDDATEAIEIATVVSAASSVALTVGSGEAAQFTTGDVIDIRLAANGSDPELRTIATISTDTITVTEALSGTPAAGDTVRPAALTIPDGYDEFVRADVDGMTDAADGSGTLITDLLLLDRHVLENFVFGDYYEGAWIDQPTFEFYPGGATSYLMDRESWQTASDVGATYNDGSPLQGSFVIGAGGRRQSTRTVMADFARSGNFRRAWRGNNQFFVAMLDRVRTSFLGGRRTITDRRDILSAPRFAPTPMKEWLCNDLFYQYRENYRDDGHGAWWFTGEVGKAASKDQYGVKVKIESYPMISETSSAEAVAQQRIDFMSILRDVWTWGQSLCALQTSELLTGVAVTHYGGKGGSGFIDNGMWVERQVVVPKTGSVVISAVDVDDLLDAVAVDEGSPGGGSPDEGSPTPFGGPYGPTADIVPPTDAVMIETTDNPQSIINAHSAGTTYAFAAGTHNRTSAIVPKTGDTFIGEFGAILDGSGWSSSDSTQACFRAHNENVDDVTISNLVIRNFPQSGVHAFHNYSSGWVVEYCEIHDCAHKGVSMGTSCIVRYNDLHDNPNGNYSAFGGNDTLFDSNEISYGGSEQKIVAASGVIFRNNWVHHNDNGIWYDFANSGILVEDNVCEDNTNDGIVIEGSPGDVGPETPSTNLVRNNISRNNGLHGIFVTLSHYIEVYGNTLSGNERGIGYFVDLSVLETGLDLAQCNSHDNDITTSGAGGSSNPWCAAFTYSGSSPDIDPYLDPTDKFLVFEANDYHVSDPASGQYWRWGTVQKTFAQWQAVPQDTTGTAT